MIKTKKDKTLEISKYKHFRFKAEDQRILNRLCKKLGEDKKPVTETYVIKML